MIWTNSKINEDSAVSPVVGVMLMLVVTIIVAAVVSGFTGNMVSGTSKAPQLSMDAEVINSGYWQSSYFKAEVTGVDEAIDTADLKLVTSWSKKLLNGSALEGGATVVPGETNFNVYYKVCGWSTTDTWKSVCPQGYGPGVGQNFTEVSNFWPYELLDTSPHYPTPWEHVPNPRRATMEDVWNGSLGNYSWFGNYKMQAGTELFARPFGGSYGGQATGMSGYSVGYGMEADTDAGNTGGGRYYYSYGDDSSGHATFDKYPDSIDQMQAIFGNNWNELRAGDTINMKVVHTPSGKVIWQKDIVVEG
ncbi:FlaG/FlaF family flagellin (archaellin) [Methanomicrobium sp. W14]|uniref:type IV pilin n=1 Tax=Methanomicrobium sp. W14 TaxID=2817839 RepID=UPI001AE44307|nr:type IV pilin [Methanomicrobium sp. W14]MBP2134026.1 FlaG/FlaF family flagellin (archaellin) [Methanomicrobium sp. W14]